TDVQ
ncbi:hypothetical protein CFC21_047689, partial [Triticum aestivum]